MKRILTVAALVLLGAGSFHAAEPPSAAEQQVTALFKEIQLQQVQMAENQVAIEAKLAAVAEAVRIARTYASRPGSLGLSGLGGIR